MTTQHQYRIRSQRSHNAAAGEAGGNSGSEQCANCGLLRSRRHYYIEDSRHRNSVSYSYLEIARRLGYPQEARNLLEQYESERRMGYHFAASWDVQEMLDRCKAHAAKCAS